MKSILVPVDFSKSADNAARYAIQIAKETKARLIFFHTFLIPVSTQDVYVGEEILSELERTNVKELTQYTADLLASVPESTRLVFHNEVQPGFIQNHLPDLIKSHNVDLIVMGTRGQSGTLKKLFVGSNAARVMEESPVPVLVVPERAMFKPVQKVVFATNLDIPDIQQRIEPLFEWTWLHPMELHFVVVIPPGTEMHSPQQLQTYLELEGAFKHTPHFLEVLEDTDVTGAIDSYVNEIQADMLVTSPRKHGFFEKLFSQSVTREMVFQTDIPILCLK